MLSFFPLDVLDEIWDLIEQFLRDFLPTLNGDPQDQTDDVHLLIYNKSSAEGCVSIVCDFSQNRGSFSNPTLQV